RTLEFAYATNHVSNKKGESRFDTALLTTAKQVHGLTAEQARLGYPVQIEGIVTYYDPEQHFFFIQDKTGGIFAYQFDGQILHPGQKIKVSGVTIPGHFAPSIGQPQVQILGVGNLPAPAIPTFDEALSGEFDSCWVVLEGVVHPTRRDANSHILF